MNVLRRTAWMSLACLAGLAPSRARAEEGPGPKIDALVRAAKVTDASPGCAVLVVGPQGVLFAKGYGRADLERGTPITRSTTFELASVSKQFTGMATLLLVTRGKAAFDEDVRKHLPQLPEYDKQRPITLGDLSRHTSGLPEYLEWEDAQGSHPGYVTNADLVLEFARRREQAPLRFPTGEKYEYCNSGYMLLGAVIEKISGVSFGAFLQAEIFQPLGMKTAWVNERPDVRTHAPAVGYTWVDDDWSPTWAAPTPERHERILTTGDGSVWASLDDMAAWDAGLRAGKPVKTETFLAALAPTRDRGGKVIGYALGWTVEYDGDGKPSSISHSGRWAGFETFLGHDVASGLTVVVLSNRDAFDAEGLAEKVGALFQPTDPEGD